MGPTSAGFLTFIRDIMAISTAALPDNSPAIPAAYNIAMTLVNRALAGVPSYDVSQPSLYALAVYNLGGDRLVNFAPDQSGSTYFADLRKSLNIAGFVSGVVSSTNDEGTGASFIVPEQMSRLTVSQLQNLKTPWGRIYIGITQSYGPAAWGLS